MVFRFPRLSGLSSAIGKRLLIFGLRHIDILDKDPQEFESVVDVGKRTTLEVRDVGLHVKKLLALLHLKLPPEIHLSSARASLFRITFVLELGVPRIIVEIDGIQIRARLVEDANCISRSRGTERTPPRDRSSPLRRTTSTPPGEASGDVSSDDDDFDDHIPNVDELARSFINEESREEIKELEQELESQSVHLQDSVSESDDDDDSTSGMGAPLALPNYIRNLLNTALDRLQIIVKDIDVDVEDQIPAPTASFEDESSYTSINFHVDRVAIDSVTADKPLVDITKSTTPQDASSKIGKRRLRVENICGRLISDARNFARRASVPSSPADTRSEVSSSQKVSSESAGSDSGTQSGNLARSTEAPLSASASIDELVRSTALEPEPVLTQASIHSSISAPDSPSSLQHPLVSSVHTTDDDRFADAASDDGLEHSITGQNSSPSASRDLDANNFFGGGLYEVFSEPRSPNNIWDLDGTGSSHEAEQSYYESESSTSNLPTVSMLGRSAQLDRDTKSPSHSKISDPGVSTGALDHSGESLGERAPSPALSQDPADSTDNLAPVEEDLSQSKFYSHEEAKSLYMSALSNASPRDDHVPGAWETSSSASSQGKSSDKSSSIPEDMIAGSILGHAQETDDGCETPRANSPTSVFSSPHQIRQASATALSNSERGRNGSTRMLAKVFLTVDEITVWFPLDLGEEPSIKEPMVQSSGLNFNPSGLAEDSIFEGMPGSFSNYAHSTSSRRKPAVDNAARPRSDPHVHPPESKKQFANVSVEVGSVLCHIDYSTGHIMFQMLTKATAALAGNTDESKKETTKPEESSVPSESCSSIEISVRAVCIAWRERLLIESFTDSRTSRSPLESDPLDAIIKVTMSSIYGASQTTAKEVQTELQIGKFALSSMDHDIVTFQSSRSKARRTVSNAADQLKHDIELVYEQKQERRVTMITRPVNVLFDLQKMDEALGSFGGFSGILELSTSFSSSNRGSPIASQATPRPRGVHFGDTPPPPSVSASILPKIQVQLGDVLFVLKGQSCAVQLQTTSVRAAIRGTNVRMKVVDVQFTGPYVDDSQAGSPVIVKIQESTLSFLSAPEEVDQENLISMVKPTKDPYEDDKDIVIENLVRQRKKGSLLRLDLKSVDVRVSDTDQLHAFGALGAEMAKFSKITKYLPDDDRPGILTLANVQEISVRAKVNERLGDVLVKMRDTSVAHVGLPSLFATKIGSMSAWREEEPLIHAVVNLAEYDQLPMVMMRIVGDEVEPVIKAKLFNVCAEYHVSTVMAALGLSEDGTVDDIVLGLASSVATVTGATPTQTVSGQDLASSSPSSIKSKPLHLDVLFRNCALGLNPRKIPAKGLVVLTDAHFLGTQLNTLDYSVELELRKASIQAIDDVARLEEKQEPSRSSSKDLSPNPQLRELVAQGYVTLSSLAAAKILVSIAGDGEVQPRNVDVKFQNELFVIESCADSTQTLIAILSGLQPPMPPSTAERYRTAVPLREMMESFTMDSPANDPDAIPIDDEDPVTIEDEDDFMETADLVMDEVPTSMEFVGSFYNPSSLPTEEDLGDSMLGEDDLGALANPPITHKRGERATLQRFEERYEVAPGHEQLDFDEDYFKDTDSDYKGKARKWDNLNNKYHLSNEFRAPNAPLKVQIHDMNIIWNLYDGYDWPKTRSKLAEAIDDVEARAEERRRKAKEDDDEDLDFIEEGQLFNSVWIGVPIKEAKGTLAKQIMQDINRGRDGDDTVSETGSYATSATRTTAATMRPGSTVSTKRLQRLGRGKHKRISFDLKNVAADFVVFEPGSSETVSSVDLRVRDLIIYDRVPGSTWNKFALCDVKPEKREMNRPMINIGILTVKPTADLTATELVIEVSILPLRLHVDQFALEFIKRFFEFKDDSAAESSTSSEQPFIQRLEVNTVKVKLDYKPRKVDYRSLRSGSTTELMNFLTLENADIILRHAILYGIKSFDELHSTLNGVWMPDVRQNQLAQVLSGLALLRPVVNVGSGVADLFVVPMREYRKDGRVVRSLRKGMGVFARNTTSEAARLGAKVAIGAQTILEGAERFLNPPPPSQQRHHDWDGSDPSDADEPRATSNYADQPITVAAGLRSAARHFKRDWAQARDAVIAIPAEIVEEGTGAGMAKVLAKRAPTVVLKPMAGATKAVSRTLLGVGNALDPESRRKIQDKYKTY